jgi:hypothetical protein
MRGETRRRFLADCAPFAFCLKFICAGVIVEHRKIEMTEASAVADVPRKARLPL